MPLWKHAVPVDFQEYHAWDFSKFVRGERFVYGMLPREQFYDILHIVERWGLDDSMKERRMEKLVHSGARI